MARAREARIYPVIERRARTGSRLRPLVPVVLLAAVLAAGCTSGTTATPTPVQPQALPAGTYTSTAFRPAVTFTLPAGWLISQDSADFLALQPVTTNALGIYLFRSPQAASQQADCPTAAAMGVGARAKDLVEWIEARPGLETDGRASVALGGLVGFELDLAIEAGWTASCPFADGLPTVPLIVGATTGLRWVVAGNERLRLTVLDVPGGGTVVVDIDAFDGSLFDGFLPVAGPIVESLRFAAL
jgi:hypothetical protein